MSTPVHAVCPHCAAVNRIPQARLTEGPKCGKCQHALFDGEPIELTGETFQTHVGRSDLPVLVDFWAPWCGPCLRMAPFFAEAARRLEPGVRLAKLDTEAHPEIGTQYAIRSIPSLILFRAGREVARELGAMRAEDIVRWVESKIAH